MASVKGSAVPLVSIVTVVYNGQKYLQAAIDSVRGQSYASIEYIVIDGASTDGTLELIKANEDIITDWVSEPDDGIYDAMNKGIARASGLYIGLLNADDVLLPHGVKKAVEALETLGEPGYTCAAVELIDEMGKKYGTSTPFPEKQRLRRRYLEMPCPHLGVFVHREVYENFGVFDTSLRLAADRDLLLRFIDNGVACARLEEPLGQFRQGGVSGGKESWLEIFAVHRMHNKSLVFSVYVFIRSITKSSMARVAPGIVKRNIWKLLASKNTYE